MKMKDMRRWIACLAVVLLCMQTAVADEGMWLINRLGEIYPQMKSKGLKIKDKEIYNEQTSALADAVVAVDGGMGTGSMISDEGLMITNHHVAFSDICALSTPEHNYLETGFWARTRGEEIPVAGKTVWFLRKVVDVTEEVEAIRNGMMAEGKWGIMGMRRVYKEIEDRYAAQTEHEVSCYSMWGGKMYLMFYYDVYKDVRLVGTPPITLGAFGGDHDNWGWPQHKGDFTLYRVYADAEGRPAEYSAGNVPLKPRRVLRIATGGVHDGDFAMVIGFPGHTNRYASSFAVAEKQRVKNPVVVANRHDRMDILKRHMERDPKVRMKYSDSYFGLSNYAVTPSGKTSACAVSTWCRSVRPKRSVCNAGSKPIRRAGPRTAGCLPTLNAATRAAGAPNAVSTISVRRGSVRARRCWWPTACRRTSASWTA